MRIAAALLESYERQVQSVEGALKVCHVLLPWSPFVLCVLFCWACVEARITSCHRQSRKNAVLLSKKRHERRKQSVSSALKFSQVLLLHVLPVLPSDMSSMASIQAINAALLVKPMIARFPNCFWVQRLLL